MDDQAKTRVDALAEAKLPVDTLREALPHLRRPFSPAAVRWKVQTSWDSGGLVVAHIDARLVIERLNAVCGDLWEERFELFGSSGKTMLCHLTVDGRTHTDVGRGDDAKAILSDARKRAAVPFGVGVSIYALPTMRLDAGAGPGKLSKRVGKGKHEGKVFMDITPGTLEGLRELYERWLAETGLAAFGPALDHGDVIGTAGLEEGDGSLEETAPEDVQQDLPALESEEAEQLRGRIRLAYDTVREKAPTRLLPGQFDQKLRAANHSEEALAALLEEISGLAREVSK